MQLNECTVSAELQPPEFGVRSFDNKAAACVGELQHTIMDACSTQGVLDSHGRSAHHDAGMENLCSTMQHRPWMCLYTCSS